jgi:hypothetical protein
LHQRFVRRMPRRVLVGADDECAILDCHMLLCSSFA